MSIPKNLQFILHYPAKVDFSRSDWDLFNEIKAFVNQIKTFTDPKIISEQYSLPSDLISFILILVKKDLSNCNIVDLGCGTGRFTLPISKHFSNRVLGVDNDFTVLNEIYTNMKKLNLQIDLLNTSIEFVEANKWKHLFQTTIMNPPFGTQRRGIDQVFLRKSLSYSEVVLSLHKTSKKSRNLWKKIASSHDKQIELLSTIEFSLPRTFNFHRRNQHSVTIDLVRFSNKDFS
ncbi:MAG: METTL5 family protein [Candidatus Hodarchaeales archaeon]